MKSLIINEYLVKPVAQTWICDFYWLIIFYHRCVMVILWVTVTVLQHRWSQSSYT